MECKIRGIPAKNCTKSIEESRSQKAAKRHSCAVEADKDKLLKDLEILKNELISYKLQ